MPRRLSLALPSYLHARVKELVEQGEARSINQYVVNAVEIATALSRQKLLAQPPSGHIDNSAEPRPAR